MTGAIGVVGGVGPLAAAHFYQRLLQLSGADRDEDYPTVILIADRVPSRIAHLAGRGPSPLPVLVEVARRLVAAGAESIAIPSATTHAYREEIAAAGGVPVFNLLEETGRRLRERQYRHPLVLATESTVRLGLYEPHLEDGIRAHYPSASEQHEVNGFIEAVKRGTDLEVYRRKFAQWINEIAPRSGADSVVLGCTELPVINPSGTSHLPTVDTTDVLAEAVLRAQWHRKAMKQCQHHLQS
ncbi:aspartate/glutamate racemase family protein [Streptomyces rubellomurinus]|uniref:aspartate/glutamate racemase family protein n=1 Tax=Streptomyces rubellomurinus (strain ATCC 31215) TaxID=359131 RepID=UPI0005F16F6A|nr:amino acid racemase [Streptomyces rubellomurinus]